MIIKGLGQTSVCEDMLSLMRRACKYQILDICKRSHFLHTNRETVLKRSLILEVEISRALNSFCSWIVQKGESKRARRMTKKQGEQKRKKGIQKSE